MKLTSSHMQSFHASSSPSPWSRLPDLFDKKEHKTPHQRVHIRTLGKFVPLSRTLLINSQTHAQVSTTQSQTQTKSSTKTRNRQTPRFRNCFRPNPTYLGLVQSAQRLQQVTQVAPDAVEILEQKSVTIRNSSLPRNPVKKTLTGLYCSAVTYAWTACSMSRAATSAAARLM